MSAVRMNITLPAKTASLLKKRVKPRERSQVIAEALELYFRQDPRKELVRDLIEAYSQRGRDDSGDFGDWDVSVADGLDDETR
jgi:metal-responsive CopG/Arc/MetJ family transcriptional regulator